MLDLTDDPAAIVLRSHLGRSGLPVKMASVSPGEDFDHLPDRLFALVGTASGEPIRKYAMHDAPHLAASILYFLECGGQLPDAVRAKVAQNLIEACGWYETPPPLALTKVALLGSVVGGLLGVDKIQKAKQQNVLEDARLRAAQLSGVKTAVQHVSTSSQEEASAALDRFIRGEEKSTEAQFAELCGDDVPNLFKEANLAGSEAGSFGGLSKDPRPQTPQKRFAVALKTSSWSPVGAFALLEPLEEAPAARMYALPHRGLYPIDTAEQVKRASTYFDEYSNQFDTDDRRIYAKSVAERAQELDVPISGAVQKIASNEYGPHIAAELQARIAMLEGTGKEASYEVLLENLGATPPIVMYDMLKHADAESGLDQGYGRPVTGVREPLSAVFGAPEKPIYSWVGRGHYVTEEQLRSYSKLVPDPLDKVMGDGWVAKFCDDPIKEFDKLPDAKKIVIARLANGEAFRFI